MYDGRHTMGVTVAIRAYGGRGTTGTATAGKSAFRRLKVDIPAVRGQYSCCQNVALHGHEI